jgi:hypothetical protein
MRTTSALSVLGCHTAKTAQQHALTTHLAVGRQHATQTGAGCTVGAVQVSTADSSCAWCVHVVLHSMLPFKVRMLICPPLYLLLSCVPCFMCRSCSPDFAVCAVFSPCSQALRRPASAAAQCRTLECQHLQLYCWYQFFHSLHSQHHRWNWLHSVMRV